MPEHRLTGTPWLRIECRFQHFMAEQNPKSTESGKTADAKANQPAQAPPQYTLRDSGKPLPPPVRRISPLTARRPVQSPKGQATPPTAPAAAEAKAPAVIPQVPTQGVRPNPLTARRSLPSIAVISPAEPPPQVHAHAQEEPSSEAADAAQLPATPEPDPLPEAAESAPEADIVHPEAVVDSQEIPVVTSESEQAANEPVSAAVEAVAAEMAAVAVPVPADDGVASVELASTANLPASESVSGAAVGFVPGAALAFLSAAQRARVREQAPFALPEVPLPPAAAALAALGRREKAPGARPIPQPQPMPPVAPPLAALPAAPPPVLEALPAPANPVEAPLPVTPPPPSLSENLPAPATPVENLVSVPAQMPHLPSANPTAVVPLPASDVKAVISVRGIAKVYTMGDVEVRALQGVDLDIMVGEMTAIMGPSGSGKSTLMNILGCLDVPTSGTYLLDGEDVSRMTDDQLADVRSRKIGFVFQSFNLLSRTSALANVELPLLYSGSGARSRHRRAQQALELVGLGSRIHHKPNELSGGQQQRVAIARALINEPAMILADEPTGNLDSKTSVEIMELFQRLNSERGITIIFVTHNIETADYCHRVVHVRDGRVERDVRHRPRAGIYRDLLPEDLPLDAVRAPASDGAYGGPASAAATSASPHTDPNPEVSA